MSRLDAAWASAASALRGGRGRRVLTEARREPSEPLELWEFEACPCCRKVREALSEGLRLMRPCAWRVALLGLVLGACGGAPPSSDAPEALAPAAASAPPSSAAPAGVAATPERMRRFATEPGALST